MLRTIAVQNYRSLRDLVLPLVTLNVVTGAERQRQVEPLPRAAAARRDRAAAACRRRWRARAGCRPRCGPARRRSARAVRRGEHPVQGTVRRKTGQPAARVRRRRVRLRDRPRPAGAASGSAFALDPEIKRECIWSGPVLRPATLLVDRRGPLVQVAASDGEWAAVDAATCRLRQHADRARRPAARARAADAARADPRPGGSTTTSAPTPTRRRGRPQIGTRTPVLGHDGARPGRRAADDPRDRRRRRARRGGRRRVPGRSVSVSTTTTGRFELRVHQHGLLRPLTGGRAVRRHAALPALGRRAAHARARPSCWCSTSPRPACIPDLLPALARLMITAAERSQLVDHHALGGPGRRAAQAESGVTTVELIKELGETRIAGQGPFEGPTWSWGRR